MLSFQSLKSILKEEHNTQMIKGLSGSAQACRVHSKSRKYRRDAVGTRADYRRSSKFSRESYRFDVRYFQSPRRRVRAARHDKKDIFSKRRSKVSRDERKKKPLASSLLSECLACHAVLVSNIFSRRRSRLRATRHDYKTSFQRAGHGQMTGGQMTGA